MSGRPIRYTARPSWPTPPLTEVDQAALRVAYRRFEVELIAARAAAGVPEAVESLPQAKAELERMVAELHLLEGTVSTIARRDETITSWRAKVGALSRELQQLQADAVKLPPEWVKSEAARLREEIKVADQAGRQAFRTYHLPPKCSRRWLWPDLGILMVVAASTQALRAKYPTDWIRALLTLRRGLLLAPQAAEDYDFFGLRGRPQRMPKGRGFVCGEGAKHLVQIAHAE